MFDELILDSISQIVGISKYHFRRVFKAVCGENIGLYIQRLRLEYIAFKLISTDISVPFQEHSKVILGVQYPNFADYTQMQARMG